MGELSCGKYFNWCVEEGDLQAASLVIPLIDDSGPVGLAFVANLDENGQIESAEIELVEDALLDEAQNAAIMDMSELNQQTIAGLRHQEMFPALLEMAFAAQDGSFEFNIVDNDGLTLSQTGLFDGYVAGSEPDHILTSYLFESTNFVAEYQRYAEHVLSGITPPGHDASDPEHVASQEWAESRYAEIDENLGRLQMLGQIDYLRQAAIEATMDHDEITPASRDSILNALTSFEAPDAGGEPGHVYAQGVYQP